MRATTKTHPRLIASIACYGHYLRHGDFQRIAEATCKKDGSPYSADYVRKVLQGQRMNAHIERLALRYFKGQQALQQSLNRMAARRPD